MITIIKYYNNNNSKWKNIPQLIIQVISIIYTYVKTVNSGDYFDISKELITILSLIFTLVSIFLSICEYFLSKQFVNLSTFVIVSFEAQCNDFKNMLTRKFRQRIIFQQNILNSKIGRLLKIEFSKVERLKPLHTQNGAIFVFYIDISHSDDFDYYCNLLRNMIPKGDISRAIEISYQLKQEPKLSDVSIKRGGSDSHGRILSTIQLFDDSTSTHQLQEKNGVQAGQSAYLPVKQTKNIPMELEHGEKVLIVYKTENAKQENKDNLDDIKHEEDEAETTGVNKDASHQKQKHKWRTPKVNHNGRNDSNVMLYIVDGDTGDCSHPSVDHGSPETDL